MTYSIPLHRTAVAPAPEVEDVGAVIGVSRPHLPMTATDAGRQRLARLAIGVVVAVGTLVRIPQLFHSLNESFAFRQAQTAFVVRQYGSHGIDLFSTPLPVFGPHADVPMEFPLFQAIASLLVSVGIPADTATRILGLLAFQATAILFGMLLARWHGRAVAVVGVTLFEFLPFGLQWGAAALIDFFALALALLMLVGLDRWFRGGSSWWLVAGSIGAVLGALVKITTLPAWGPLLLVSAFLVIRERGWHRSWRRLGTGFALGPVLGLALTLAWTMFADSIKRSQELTEFLTSSNLTAWNFGTLAQRVDPHTYLTIISRVRQEIVGPSLVGLLLAAVAVIFMRDRAQRWFTVGWFAVAISGPLVFFNLFFVHSYYLIGVYPAFVAIVAIGGVWLVRLLPLGGWRRIAIGALALAEILLTTATSSLGRYDIDQFVSSAPIPALSQQILDHTAPGDQLVLIGCDWDPITLFYGERTGVMFRAPSPHYWQSHQIQNYRYLARCDGAADPAAFLPAGSVAVPDDSPYLFRIESGHPSS